MTLRETNAIPRPLDNGDITGGRRETRTPDRGSGGGSPIARLRDLDPLVRLDTKVTLSTFNSLQARSFAQGISMAAMVREAIVEKLRRER